MTDCLKLDIFADSSFCYVSVTVFQILVTQFTGILISKHRDSKVLFIGLSASSYVIAGSVSATILFTWTQNMLVSVIGGFFVHAGILAVLCNRIRDIGLRYQERESIQGQWGLCLIPVFFYCSFSFLAFFPYTLDENPHNIPGVIFFIITMIISYVVALRYLESESERAETYWKSVFIKSYVRELEKQYHLLEQSDKNLKIMRHDMHHYSGMINSLLDQEEYDEIRKLAEYIKSVADENKVVKYCNNLTVNSILTHMVEKAHALGVTVQLEAAVPKELSFSDYEFAAVVANLLENAISHVSRFERKDKRVQANIHCADGHVLIHMQNEYEQEIMLDGETGLPRRAAGEGHGLGMQSVQNFSEKIGGNLGCYCEEGIFHIMLFAKI
jgi:branched-subunit amino acid transport protein